MARRTKETISVTTIDSDTAAQIALNNLEFLGKQAATFKNRLNQAGLNLLANTIAVRYFELRELGREEEAKNALPKKFEPDPEPPVKINNIRKPQFTETAILQLAQMAKLTINPDKLSPGQRLLLSLALATRLKDAREGKALKKARKAFESGREGSVVEVNTLSEHQTKRVVQKGLGKIVKIENELWDRLNPIGEKLVLHTKKSWESELRLLQKTGKHKLQTLDHKNK